MILINQLLSTINAHQSAKNEGGGGGLTHCENSEYRIFFWTEGIDY